MGGLEGRSVVGAVAGHGHDLVVGLQGLDESLLVHRTCACDDLHVAYALAQGGVVEFGEFHTGDDVGVAVGPVVPESYLTADLAGRAGGVAGDNLHLDACVKYFADCVGHVGADGVGDGCHAEELQALGCHLAVGYRGVAFADFLIGESERTHGHVLVFQQQGVDFGLGHAGGVGAHGEYDFRRALDVEYGLARG